MERLSFEKVFYHVDHLNDYINKGDCYPVHMIAGLANRCNHACIWCYAHDTISTRYNDNNFAPAEMIVNTINEAAQLGLRSVTLVGTGEPTLHPEFIEIIKGIKSSGVDIGIFTNGSLINEQMAEVIVNTHTFLRLSCSGYGLEEHNKIHHAGRPVNDFDRIVDNMMCLLNKRVNKRGGQLFPTIGVQFSVNHHNYKSLLPACRFWKDVGVDYYALKPVYKNRNVPEHEDNEVPFDEVIELMKEAELLEDNRFKVYAKHEQFKKVLNNKNTHRGYEECHGQAFTTFLDPDGTLYICGNMHGQEKFSIGNVMKSGSFKAVWEGEVRRLLLRNLDVSKCPIGCRMDPLNLIIEDLTKPAQEIHPNFL